MFLFDMIKAVLLGIIQGITEWLPVSSTGHMILFNSFFPMSSSLAKPDTPEFAFWGLFLVVIQLGSILAVCVLYFHKLNPFSPTKKPAQKRATLELWSKIILACIPAAIIGLLIDDIMEKYLMNGYVVAATLIIYGVLFIVIENANKSRNFEMQRVGDISYQTALYIGLFQLLSLIPGTSRSGSTILGAMILGCSRGAAAEFSFFLGIPVMFGASFLKIVKYGLHFTGPQVFYLILGMVVAFIVSVYAIRFLMGYIRKHDFKFFGYYRIVLGAIVLVYFGITAFIG